jgi:hypothetical protein
MKQHSKQAEKNARLYKTKENYSYIGEMKLVDDLSLLRADALTRGSAMRLAMQNVAYTMPKLEDLNTAVSRGSSAYPVRKWV